MSPTQAVFAFVFPSISFAQSEGYEQNHDWPTERRSTLEKNTGCCTQMLEAAGHAPVSFLTGSTKYNWSPTPRTSFVYNFSVRQMK